MNRSAGSAVAVTDAEVNRDDQDRSTAKARASKSKVAPRSWSW